jgi:hypothetical protein
MTRPANYRVSRLLLSAFSVVLVSAGMVAAQDPNSYNSTSGSFYQPTPQYPIEMGLTQHHSSTLAESWARGRSAMIQAYGNYQINANQARILSEQARWLEHENDMKWKAQREQLQLQRAERRLEGQKKLAARRSTVYRQAYQLSSTEFNRGTGEINWPAALQDARYQPARERVNELFRSHVVYGEPQADTAAAIAQTIAPIARMLRQDVSNLPREEYLAAQKFLIGLKYEAKSLVEAS